jgi:heterodisulfide reductase subunit B
MSLQNGRPFTARRAQAPLANDLTRDELAVIMVTMADRNLQIARFIGETPSLAYCDVCRLAFRTKQEFLFDADKAKQQLQSEFEKHECRPEPEAVDEALVNIK